MNGAEGRTGHNTGHDTGHDTGDERVDAAVARLAELETVPPSAHPEIFQDVHRRLQDTLAGIDGEQT